MSRYRKKPVEIEAIQMPPHDQTDFGLAPDWFKQALARNDVRYLNNEKFLVRTDEGQMVGVAWDYLIKGVEGELYPCRKSVFEATYDPID